MAKATGTPSAIAEPTPMSAQQAAQFLASLPSVESGLSARLVGIGSMIMGLGLIASLAVWVAIGANPVDPDAPILRRVGGPPVALAILCATIFVQNAAMRAAGLNVAANPWNQGAMKQARPLMWRGLVWGMLLGVVGAGIGLAVILMTSDAGALVLLAKAAVAVLGAGVQVAYGLRMRAFYPEPTATPVATTAFLAMAAVAFSLAPPVVGVALALAWLGVGSFVHGVLLWRRG